MRHLINIVLDFFILLRRNKTIELFWWEYIKFRSDFDEANSLMFMLMGMQDER